MHAFSLRLIQRGSPFELTDACVRGVPCKVFAKGPQTLNDIYRKAEAFPQRDYLVSGAARLTVGEVLARAARLAFALQKDFGIHPDMRVAIVMDNCPEWVVAFVAVTSLGATAVVVHSASATHAMHALVTSDPSAVICGLAQAEWISRVESFKKIIVAGPRDTGRFEPRWVSLDDLLAGGGESSDVPAHRAVTPAPETTALIAFTSGTTGIPKGVVLSHRNLTTGLMNMMLGGALHASRAAASRSPAKPVAGSPCVLMLAPLSHIGGYAQLLLMLHIAGKMVFLPEWRVAEAVHLIEREKVRSLTGSTPAMLRELIGMSRAGCDLSSLSSFHIHGAALHAGLADELTQAFPHAVIGTGYGLTETCGSVCSAAGAELRERPLSSGLPLPSVDIKLVDEQGGEVAPGESGEILIRGAMVMQGYWAAPEQTAAVLEDGWFKTGDLGQWDAQGHLQVLDRFKDVLVHQGRQLSSTAMERVAMDCPTVEEAAVVGVMPTAATDELWMAVIVKDGDDVSIGATSSMAERLRAHLSLPELSLRIMPCAAFPRTPSGKIDRNALKQQLLRTMQAGVAAGEVRGSRHGAEQLDQASK